MRPSERLLAAYQDTLYKQRFDPEDHVRQERTTPVLEEGTIVREIIDAPAGTPAGVR